MTTLILNKRTGEWLELKPPEKAVVPVRPAPLLDYDPIGDEWLPVAPEPPALTFSDVAEVGIWVGRGLGKVVWFALAIPVGIIAHVGMALFSRTNTKPEPPAYGSRRPARPRRVTIEREYHFKEKITVED